MPKIIETSTENPFVKEVQNAHAGKVFVFSNTILTKVQATGSDGSHRKDVADHFFLCLWDLDDDSSLWITLQSEGEFELPRASKRMHSGTDENWMSEQKVSRHRNGTLWRLGYPGTPVKFTQSQKRYVLKSELETIRARISQKSLDHFAIDR